MQYEVILFVLFWLAAFLILGQNVASVLLGAGIVGIAIVVGPKVFNGILAQDVFFSASSYSLSIIPLYLVMAQFLIRGGVIDDLFAVAFRLSGRRRFPLGVATIITGGLLGAVSGSGAATSASLATMASPHLEQAGYSRRLSISIAAVAGSLSAIIPPSIIMIVYGSLTLIPVGHLFIGALLPGVLCILVYIACLHFFGELGPGHSALTTDTPDPSSLVKSAIAFAFVCGLMIIVFGGIYGGVITAAEAGAVGAFIALAGMVSMRRINIKGVFEALADAVKITSMLMMIVIGAQIFGRFLSISRAPKALLSFMEPLLAWPDLLVGLMLLIFFLFGLFLESVAVMVLLIPVVMPLLLAANVDLLWFGVMACFMISLGLLTPPVGLATYAACSATGYSVGPVFRKTGVFALTAAAIISILMVMFPAIVTWLPNEIQ